MQTHGWVMMSPPAALSAVMLYIRQSSMKSRLCARQPATLSQWAPLRRSLRNLPGGTKAQGAVVFSISFDGKRDFFNSTVVLQNMGPDTLAHVPASLQRIDACDAGETLTYYYIAYGGGPEALQLGIEGVSKLVVQFFNREL
jgi:hypothetical protein